LVRKLFLKNLVGKILGVLAISIPETGQSSYNNDQKAAFQRLSGINESMVGENGLF